MFKTCLNTNHDNYESAAQLLESIEKELQAKSQPSSPERLIEPSTSLNMPSPQCPQPTRGLPHPPHLRIDLSRQRQLDAQVKQQQQQSVECDMPASTPASDAYQPELDAAMMSLQSMLQTSLHLSRAEHMTESEEWIAAQADKLQIPLFEEQLSTVNAILDQYTRARQQQEQHMVEQLMKQQCQHELKKAELRRRLLTHKSMREQVVHQHQYGTLHYRQQITHFAGIENVQQPYQQVNEKL